jgi:hypothetical protein
MNRATLVDKLTEVQRIVQHLLDQLQASEHDKFAAHLYRPAGNTGTSANAQASQASKSSGASSQASMSPRAWALRASFGSGSTCCGSEIDRDFLYPHSHTASPQILANP